MRAALAYNYLNYGYGKCAPNAHDLNNLTSLEVQTHMQTVELGVLHGSSPVQNGPVLLRAHRNGYGRDMNGDCRRWSSAELTLHFSSECFGSVLSCVEFVTKGGRRSKSPLLHTPPSFGADLEPF